MPSSQADTLKTISKHALKEFGRRGFQLFEKPARQLFSHNSTTGALIEAPGLQHNQRELARMALAFRHCSGAYNLRQSLKASPGSDGGGSSLVYSAGCKLLLAVKFDGDADAELVGLAVVVNLREDVLESRHLRMIAAAGEHLPAGGLWIELVCAKPHSGAATYLLLTMLKTIGGARTCIMANPTNAASRSLMYERHGYEELLPGKPQLAVLTRSAAYAHRQAYLDLLPGYEQTMRLCTRAGIRDTTKTYWDCSR